MKKFKKLSLDESYCERGWFLGHFAKVPELNNQKVEAQIINLKTGKKKDKIGFNKKGKTLTMLLSEKGKIKISFPDEKEDVVLNKKGDFVIFSEKVKHTWECIEEADILTIRWPSLPNDVVDTEENI